MLEINALGAWRKIEPGQPRPFQDGHFLAMMVNADYREALVHRYAGLERTILLQMQG